MASSDESEKCVRRGVNQVNGVVCPVGQVIPLRGVVVPTHIEGTQINRRTFNQDRFSKTSTPIRVGVAPFNEGVWPDDPGATTTAASNAEQAMILSSPVFTL